MRTTTLPPLTVSSPSSGAVADGAARNPAMPWWLVSIVGAWGAVLLGWVAVGAIVAGAWPTATWLPAATVLETVGRGWLSVHGVGVRLGDVDLRLAPTGVTLLVGVALAVVAHHAAPAGADGSDGARWRPVGTVVAAVAASYGLAVGLVAVLVGTPAQAGRAVLAAVLLGALGALVGATHARPELLEPAPAWARALPRSIAVGLAALGAAAATAVSVGLALRWPRVSDLLASLEADGPGLVLIAVLTLAYLPTILLWGGAWVLGAGFTVGAGTVVAPGTSVLGLLPAIPVLGAVPTSASGWDWAALAGGLAAGAAAGWWWFRTLDRAGHAPTLAASAWQGALAGLGAAGVWLAASWFARGALGSRRLADLGPRFPELLVSAPPLLAVGAAAAAVGTAAYVRRRRR